MKKLVNYIKWHWKNEMMYFLFIQIFYVLMIVMILFGSSGAFAATPNAKFERAHLEVKEFYLKEVGGPVRTQTVQIETWDQSSSVLAYCRPSDPSGQFPKYITFNHLKLNNLNEELLFQIILHEYVHCEGGIGHIQMPGHFMNDGGNPMLTKDQTKKQFIEYLDYYRKFYKIGKYKVVKSIPKNDGVPK